MYLLLVIMMASVQAHDSDDQVWLTFGESSTDSDSGAVITSSGHFRGEGGVFPAISADHQQIAILHVENPHQPSVFLKIFNIDDRDIDEHFDLFLASERSHALNSRDRDGALAALQEKVQDRLEVANRYLAEHEFYPVPDLYNIRHRFDYGYFSAEDYEQARVWESETGAWNVTFDHDTEMLQMAGIDTGEIELQIRQPIEVYGFSRPGQLCRVRPVPYQGWYDDRSGTLVIGFGYIWGLHGCDVADKWWFQRLESS